MNISYITKTLKQQASPILLLLGGVIGLLASFTLTLDKIKLLEHPDFVPACSLNPVITCTSAMSSAQAVTFGIPNSMMGIVLYTALIVVSGSLLIGVAYSKRTILVMLYTAIGGFLFTNYLILQSVLVLHVVCPWCFTIWVSSPIVLLALYRLHRKGRSPILMDRYINMLCVTWYVCLFILLAVVFREYIATLF